jgi:hypothetical protein
MTTITTPARNAGLSDVQMRDALLNLGMSKSQLDWELKHGGMSLADLLAVVQERTAAVASYQRSRTDPQIATASSPPAQPAPARTSVPAPVAAAPAAAKPPPAIPSAELRERIMALLFLESSYGREGLALALVLSGKPIPEARQILEATPREQGARPGIDRAAILAQYAGGVEGQAARARCSSPAD